MDGEFFGKEKKTIYNYADRKRFIHFQGKNSVFKFIWIIASVAGAMYQGASDSEPRASEISHVRIQEGYSLAHVLHVLAFLPSA